jgi:hypothetical protein
MLNWIQILKTIQGLFLQNSVIFVKMQMWKVNFQQTMVAKANMAFSESKHHFNEYKIVQHKINNMTYHTSNFFKRLHHPADVEKISLIKTPICLKINC